MNRQNKRYCQPTASLGCKVREHRNSQFKDTMKVLDKSIKLQNNLTFSWQKSFEISQHNREARKQQSAPGYQPLPGLLASFPTGKLWALSAAPCLVPALRPCRSKAKAEREAVCKVNSQPPPAPFRDQTFRHHFGITTASLVSHLISISPQLCESCLSLWTCEKDLLPGVGEKPHSIYWSRKDRFPSTSVTFLLLCAIYYFGWWLKKGIAYTARWRTGLLHFRLTFRSWPFNCIAVKTIFEPCLQLL